jgi:putative DNA primase/helicase
MEVSMAMAAMGLARAGWAVLPLHHPTETGCSCGQADCRAVGKHPRLHNGVKGASSEPDAVRRWWRNWPSANLGLALHGLLAVDIDPRHGGSLDSLIELGLTQADLDTVISVTGGGGYHLIYRLAEGQHFKNRPLQTGLDIKTGAGYVVAPPSRHLSGRCYAWQPERGLDVLVPALIPARLVELLSCEWHRESAGRVVTAAYGAAALSAEVARLRQTLPGGRNEQLNRSAFVLGQLVADRLVSGEEVEELLRAAALAIGLEDEEVENTLRRGLAAGMASPRGLIVSDNEARYHHSDLGNAEKFVALYGDHLRYDHRRRAYYRWGGQRWEMDGDAQATRWMIEAVRRPLAARGSGEEESELRWIDRSHSDARISAALHLARVLEPVADPGDRWDTDPWALGCSNGVVDLRSGELHAGDPADLITQSCGLRYDPAASAPRWHTFLREVFPASEALVAFIQRAVGYSLTGKSSEQVLFYCWGSGANGKSTFLGALRRMMGEYAANSPVSTIEPPPGQGAIGDDLAALEGKRLVTVSELPERVRANEARLKALVGNDEITCRFLYANFRSFTPCFKLWLAGNARPSFTGSDGAMWRRVRMIPFTASFLGKEDRDLAERLQAEREGILAWAVAGAVQWAQGGLLPPAEVLAATAAGRRARDSVWQFLTSDAAAGAERFPADGFFQMYLGYCQLTREDVVSQTVFAGRAEELGWQRVRTGRGRYFLRPHAPAGEVVRS